MDCPVFALYGEKDLQVPAPENMEALDKLVKEKGKSNITVREFKGLNHLFQTAEKGAPSEYGSIEETFSETAMEAIVQWMDGVL